MNEDLISRAALDEVLDEYEGLKAHAAFTEGIMVARRELASAPAADAAPKWISVRDRLPEPYHTYLVVIKEKYSWETAWDCAVDVAGMVDGDGYIDDMWNTFNDWEEGQEVHVTHWMPLPEPPEEGRA